MIKAAGVPNKKHEDKSGLYIVATPIGNLQDITLRALEVLKNCDYILCEDTRHSRILINHYQIVKQLKSFHKFNEKESENAIIEDLRNGGKIALISDAGTPGISDPGSKLIQKCIEEEINVIPIPGACAGITALIGSGLNTDHFQFYGFLPRKQGELAKALHEILTCKITTICYESAERINDVLKAIASIDPERKIVVARELTKRFEEFIRGNAKELTNHSFKGELVLLIEGSNKIDWEHLSPIEHVAELQEKYNLSKKEAIKTVAALRQISKQQLYKAL